MFKFRSLALSVLAVMGLGLLSSCQQDEPVVPETPVITFNQQEVNVPQLGGIFAVEFSIANPIEGEAATITAPQVGWITDVDTSIDGIIRFSVAENHVVETREATFTVSYKDAADASFVVKQAEGDPSPFRFENMNLEMTGMSVDVVPVDKETRYVIFCTSQEYLDLYELYDDESLFADDIDYFKYLAESSGVSVLDYLTENTYIGDKKGWSVNGFSPGTDYVVYAYHIDIARQELLSEIVRYEFTTTTPEKIDVDFTFEFEVNGPIVYWTVDPGDFDGYYYWDAINVAQYEETYGEDADIIGYMTSYWNELWAMYEAYGYTFQELSSLCGQGREVLTVDWLRAETEYAFFVVALDEETHYVASDPAYEIMSTGVVEPSDLEITIDVKEVGSRYAVADFFASNDDPYFATIFTKTEYEDLGSTDEERIEFMLDNFSMETTTGDMLDIRIEDLYSQTDYVIVAFGTFGGVATTRAFTAEFTTSEAVVGNSVMTVDVIGYYSLEEVAGLDANFQQYYDYYTDSKALAAIETTTEPQASVYYYNIWQATEEQVEATTDANWIEMLTATYYPKEYPSTAYFVSYDTSLVFVGVAIDENGNFGPVCKQMLYFARGEEDPAEDFISWYYSDNAPARQAFSDSQAMPVAKARVLTAGRTQEAARQAEEPASITARPMETLELSRFQQRVK